MKKINKILWVCKEYLMNPILKNMLIMIVFIITMSELVLPKIEGGFNWYFLYGFTIAVIIGFLIEVMFDAEILKMPEEDNTIEN